MNKILSILACLSVAGIASTANAFDYDVPADTDGEYYLDAVRLDGNPWSGADTTIAMGRTYDIEIDLRYEVRPGLGIGEQEYSAFQQVDLFIDAIGGTSFASVSGPAPDVVDITTDGTVVIPGLLGDGILDGDQVNTATWLLAGEAEFDPTFASGVYDIAFSRSPNPFNTDGLFPILSNLEQEITVVPVPATLALFGFGLLALVQLRRKAGRIS